MTDDAFDELFSPESAKKEEPKPVEAQPEPKQEAEPVKEPAPEPKEAQQQASETEPPPQNQEPPKEPEKPRVDPEQFKGYLDEREKRQAAERELAEIRKQLASQQQARPQEPPPDIYENPDGYRQYLEAQQDTRINQLKLQQSEFFATREYGAELVDTVKQWASRLDEATANHLLAQPSPFHAAVERYRQEQSSSTLREYDYDLEKLKAKWLEEYKAQNPAPPQAAPQQQQQPAPNLPPKVAGEGGHVGQAPKQSEGDFFQSVFQR